MKFILLKYNTTPITLSVDDILSITAENSILVVTTKRVTHTLAIILVQQEYNMRKLLLLIIFSKYYAENFTHKEAKDIPVQIIHKRFLEHIKFESLVHGQSEEEFECSLVNKAKFAIMQGKSYGSELIDESILNL